MNHTDVIETLQLQPHPEGGFFSETYRSDLTVTSEGRAASTAIYYLLCDRAVSHLHRIDADEVWHAYAGTGLRVHIFDDQGYHFIDVGRDLKSGHRPQGVVRAGAWFGAELLVPDSFALVGCTVAPGFEFERFELAERQHLLKLYPEKRTIIERLTPPPTWVPEQDQSEE